MIPLCQVSFYFLTSVFDLKKIIIIIPKKYICTYIQFTMYKQYFD